MRGLLGLTCAAFLAAVIIAAPKPVSALPAALTFAQGHANAGVVEEVGRRWYRGRYVRRPYGYRRYGYNRGYYGRPYYARPYYRGWGSPYYRRRPGVSIWW